MQVVLLENVKNLGDLGDAITVKPGYARNFLIPQGKAVVATPKNIAEFESRRAEHERNQAKHLAAAQVQADTLAEMTVVVKQKAGHEGKLFGSVGAQDIAEALNGAGLDIKKAQIRLPHESLRQVGEYTVMVHLHADLDAEMHLVIEADE